MAKRFESIQQGDQLEMPASRGGAIYGLPDDSDPDRIVRVSIATDIWFDPVEEKEFVGLAHLRSDGTYGKPTEKRTIRGLAQCGYRSATRDWVEFLKQRAAAAEDGTIVPMFKRR